MPEPSGRRTSVKHCGHRARAMRPTPCGTNNDQVHATQSQRQQPADVAFVVDDEGVVLAMPAIRGSRWNASRARGTSTGGPTTWRGVIRRLTPAYSPRHEGDAEFSGAPPATAGTYSSVAWLDSHYGLGEVQAEAGAVFVCGVERLEDGACGDLRRGCPGRAALVISISGVPFAAEAGDDAHARRPVRWRP